MPYLRLSGTISSRTSLVTACSETARLTPISSPARAIIGTTPEVRERDPPARQAEPVAVHHDLERIAHLVEIIERLAHAHHHDVGEHPALGLATAIRRARRARASPGRRSRPAVRLRTSCIVPVWQKRQLSVQPTWLDTHSVPRSASGMNTISKSCPSGERSSHLRVPSVETCAVDHLGPRDDEALGEPGLLRLGDVGHRREIGGAAIVDPVPQLLGAQLGLLGLEPARLQRGADLLAGEPDEIDPAVLARQAWRAARARDRRGRESASGWRRSAWRRT